MKRDKTQKYLFDHHFFDEDILEEDTIEEMEDDLPPPPPVFSEQELEQAKSQAFRKGRDEGVSVTQAGIDQKIQNILSRIKTHIDALGAAEHERERQYEVESVRLVYALLKALLPSYEEEYARREVKEAVTKAVTNYHGKSALRVSVPSEDLVEPLKNHIAVTCQPTLSIEVVCDPAMAENDCKVTWNDGGMVRNSAEIAQDILNILKQALAGETINVHDRKEDLETASHGSAPSTQESPKAPEQTEIADTTQENTEEETGHE